MENLIYTVVQLAHNFGAVALVGSPAAALWLSGENKTARYQLAWLMALGWLAQAGSGIGFAIASYALKGALPEVAGIAFVALALKVGCTSVGVLLSGLYAVTGKRWSSVGERRMWQFMLILTATALSAAAVLRWYL